MKNGLPAGRLSSITQSTDGYLWIGTEQGLLRFDGLAFTLFQRASPDSMPLEHVLGLTFDSNEGLWIRMQDPTILRYVDGTFSTARPKSERDPLVTAVSQGRDGSVLFASRFDGVFAWKHKQFETLRSRASLPNSSPVISITTTANGEVWLGTRDSGLLRLRRDVVVPVTNGLPNQRINCLLAVGNDELYIGTDGGLVRWDGNKVTTVGVPDSLRRTTIFALARDRDANIWVGASKGLLRLNSQGASSFGEADSGKPITALFEDREGDLWAGGGDELVRIQESAFVMYPSPDHSVQEHNGPVHVDSHGTVWTGPRSGGLYSLHDGTLQEFVPAHLGHEEVYSIAGDGDDLWLGSKTRGLTHIVRRGDSSILKSYTQAEGLPHTSIYSVHQNRDGAIWAGTLTAGVSRFQDGRFTHYTSENGLVSNTILSIAEDSDGTMWFGTPSGLSSFAHNRWRTYSKQDGLPSENVSTLFEDDSGVLWIGTLHGIAFIRSGRVVACTGLLARLLDQIFGISQDQLGSLWITSATKVLRVNRSRLLSGSLSSGDVREFGASDGLADASGIRRERAIAADSSGRIWLSRKRGIGSFDPVRLRHTAAPTMVHINRLLVDGEPQNLHASLVLPANPKRIVVEYAGLNLYSPNRVRFQFRLNGFDHEWNAPVASNEADYTNLSPGSYLFRLVASNADQTWSGEEAKLRFEVAPAVWQTWWFRFASALLLLLLIVTLYRLRLQQITEHVNAQFEARLAERTRIARELHDTLLQSFHGLMLRFQAVNYLLPDKPERAKQSLQIAIDRAALAITEGRDAVQDLRSSESDRNDLVTSLTALGQEFASNEQGKNAPLFRVLVEGKPRQLYPGLQEDLYRISREAVANAFRHANATRVELDIRYAARMLRLRVRDDGAGMEPSVLAKGHRENHWGLPSMQERASAIHGRLEIWSELTRGTEIELTVPAGFAYMGAHSRLWDRLRNVTKNI